ncbi:hypothetical protein GOODEAATRI_015297 [Goodea atripinnis]|uniref:Uncharacterized protein n=1 Tax=Goodea atripinnis TaxID=208336 RepID=A0ABV0NAU7_9TELE
MTAFAGLKADVDFRPFQFMWQAGCGGVYKLAAKQNQQVIAFAAGYLSTTTKPHYHRISRLTEINLPKSAATNYNLHSGGRGLL